MKKLNKKFEAFMDELVKLSSKEFVKSLSFEDILTRINFEVHRGTAPRWWTPSKRAKSATAQVTYRPVKKLVKYLNSLLDKDYKDDSSIAAPELQFELGVCGFDRFSLKALDFCDGFNRIEWIDTAGDFHMIVAHIDENGRPCYSAQEFVRAFEAIHASELKAAKDNNKKSERENKAAEIKATKAALGKVSEETLKAIVAA